MKNFALVLCICCVLNTLLIRFLVTEALYALKGSTVQLKCTYKADAGLRQHLLWKKGTTLLSENTIMGNTDVKKRLSITGDHSLGEYHLSISDIRESDQATYSCSITRTFKAASQQLIVFKVLLAPKGSTVRIKCVYMADVAVGQRLQWRKGSIILSENTIIGNTDVKDRLKVTGDHSIGEYHLNISDSKESDEGIYQCSISGTVKLDTYQLILIIGPTDINIDNVTQDNKIPCIKGQNTTIQCTAVGGQPPPDVKLEILGSTYSGKQSAQHTFYPNSSHDGSTVVCRAGYIDINNYPLQTKSYIHLKLKPVITPFSPDIFSAEETNSFKVSCQSTGSRPAASMYWFLGQQNITPNSTTQYIHDSSIDQYTVTSNLRYSIDRRNNGQKLTCRASNVAGNMETSLSLNVKYAPVIAVENKTFSQTQSPRQIYSTSDGNPTVNTCKWNHRTKYGEHIRDFSDNNKTLTLPTVSEDKTYQDTGEYVCTAKNGIVGSNGHVEQTGFGYIISNAPPVITADNKDTITQYGKFGNSTELKVNVYSIPKYSSKRWYKGNIHLTSDKYITKEEPAIVKDVFHGIEVQLDGNRITLTISDLQEADFTNYTLRLYYGSQYVHHEVTLEISSAPEIPSNFTVTGSKETSITVQWIAGYDGGHTQTFYVEYRISGSKTWILQKMKTDNRLDKYSHYTLSGLQDKTSYELRMYAKNIFNQSHKTDIATTTTLQSEAQGSSIAVNGAVVGLLVVLLIVCAIIISILIFKKRKGKKEHKNSVDHYDTLRAQKKLNVYDELENGKGQTENVYVKTVL